MHNSPTIEVDLLTNASIKYSLPWSRIATGAAHTDTEGGALNTLTGGRVVAVSPVQQRRPCREHEIIADMVATNLSTR